MSEMAEEDSASSSLVPSLRNIVISRATNRHSYPRAYNELAVMVHEVASLNGGDPPNQTPQGGIHQTPRYTWEALSAIISILYGYMLVVLGLALPVAQLITQAIPATLYNVGQTTGVLVYRGDYSRTDPESLSNRTTADQLRRLSGMFYIYLYGGSLAFIITVNVLCLRKKARKKLAQSCRGIENHFGKEKVEQQEIRVNNHGSFYLRLGVSAFALGSMVYSGLELGDFFIEGTDKCDYLVLRAMRPALRMLFTLLQIQFIFLSENGSIRRSCYQGLIRISLAHMLATNLAEWLAIVIEETKHEIHHLNPHHAENVAGKAECDVTTSGKLLRNATPYLFPCAIEYSLICAVTLVEIWKEIRLDTEDVEHSTTNEIRSGKSSALQYTVDCTHSERGSSAGLVANVYIIISLVAFFTLRESRTETAYFSLNLCESLIHLLSILAMAIASYQMRGLSYCVHRLDSKGSLKMGLDISLLLKAQMGAYMYSIFSLIACLFTPGASVWPDLSAILQSSLQTSFILDTWWKRCGTKKEQEKKPGRQCLTFLRIVNLGLWVIAVTEKSRAELRPLQLAFYGMWSWTVITHISMPLHVFYRFHSSICLFEIWRNSYKGIYAQPDTDVVL